MENSDLTPLLDRILTVKTRWDLSQGYCRKCPETEWAYDYAEKLLTIAEAAENLLSAIKEEREVAGWHEWESLNFYLKDL